MRALILKHDCVAELPPTAKKKMSGHDACRQMRATCFADRGLAGSLLFSYSPLSAGIRRGLPLPLRQCAPFLEWSVVKGSTGGLGVLPQLRESEEGTAQHKEHIILKVLALCLALALFFPAGLWGRRATLRSPNQPLCY